MDSEYTHISSIWDDMFAIRRIVEGLLKVVTEGEGKF